MLRIIQNSTPNSGKRYYSTADYYAESQERDDGGGHRASVQQAAALN